MNAISATDTGLPADERQPIEALPFVRAATPEELKAWGSGRVFWGVTPSGDYSTDCNTGMEYAERALDYMVEHKFNVLLNWIVFEMMKRGPDRSGIEVGFLTVFARKASTCQMLLKMNKEETGTP